MFKFDLWPRTVYSSGGERNRSQTPTESTSSHRKVITLPVLLICDHQHASKDMAEQIIMWTVICVGALCCDLLFREKKNPCTASVSLSISCSTTPIYLTIRETLQSHLFSAHVVGFQHFLMWPSCLGILPQIYYLVQFRAQKPSGSVRNSLRWN